MNATVSRIVDLLFEEAEMTDENRALHDELMRNCQDRFDDLIAQGKAEDDAIAVVVDSLKGMEDVIVTQPKHRDPVHLFDGDDEEEDTKVVRIPVAQVRLLKVDLREQDVAVTETDGDEITVTWDKEDDPCIETLMEGDTLIVRRNDAKNRSKNRSWSWGGMFYFNFNVGGDVTIGIPSAYAGRAELHTLSGDIKVNIPELHEAAITTNSGDVELRTDAPITRLSVTTASGDLHVTAPIQQANLRSMSGDLTYTGNADVLEVSSVSGDVSARGRIVTAQAKSVSGDIRFTAEDERIARIKAATTSGDVDVHLPGSIAAVHLVTSSVSGDVYSTFPDHGVTSPVTVEASTVSGDVRVR